MGKADLHMHTVHSDGQPTVRELLDHVRDHTDLDVIAITDHDTIAGALEASHVAEDYPFRFIVGEEVTSVDGHVVGLFLEERVPPGMTVEQTVDAIHQQGGLAFAPHPFYRNGFFSNKGYTMMGLGERLIDARMDGIEVLNSTPTLKWANERALEFADKAGCMARLANSDAHITAAIGKSYTTFPGFTAEDLGLAIVERQTDADSERYAVSELLRYLDFWLRAMKMGVPGSKKYGVASIVARQLAE
ncbi:MAG: CehA/McbA family metallohydrolase [Chloroflexi bacterium]|nr:CehA/McbA family metallohydrolase [Chloroflexota bacterium]